ncbi:hypothetical protein [Pyrococcus sp. ST04]|uniref:hypothetical protein n=1 Tax=Pyrococcus sp. ST04 TaxID=1183377 RepID=UPI0011D260F6|nr:hypothetical protein [Pyrococcus sp. ST04]
MGIIVLSAISVSIVYLKSSGDISVLVELKDFAGYASSYITNGVVVNKSELAPLNEIITSYTGYYGVRFSFIGLKVTKENSSEIVIYLGFSHNLNNLTAEENSRIATLLGEFLKNSLKNLRITSLRGDGIYIGEKRIVMNITVNNGWSVIR